MLGLENRGISYVGIVAAPQGCRGALRRGKRKLGVLDTTQFCFER